MGETAYICESVTQEKYFVINGKILFQVKWIWKAHMKKFASDLLNLRNINQNWWVSSIICEGLSLAKCEKKLSAKVFHETYYFL